MNERIKLLAEQAERLAEDELAHLERVHNRLYSFTEGREIYNEKFALLIVEECMEQLNISNVPAPISAGLNLGRVAIKEPVGVEE
jgi:hypothetical protein